MSDLTNDQLLDAIRISMETDVSDDIKKVLLLPPNMRTSGIVLGPSQKTTELMITAFERGVVPFDVKKSLELGLKAGIKKNDKMLADEFRGLVRDAAGRPMRADETDAARRIKNAQGIIDHSKQLLRLTGRLAGWVGPIVAGAAGWEAFSQNERAHSNIKKFHAAGLISDDTWNKIDTHLKDFNTFYAGFVAAETEFGEVVDADKLQRQLGLLYYAIPGGVRSMMETQTSITNLREVMQGAYDAIIQKAIDEAKTNLETQLRNAYQQLLDEKESLGGGDGVRRRADYSPALDSKRLQLAGGRTKNDTESFTVSIDLSSLPPEVRDKLAADDQPIAVDLYDDYIAPAYAEASAAVVAQIDDQLAALKNLASELKLDIEEGSGVSRRMVSYEPATVSEGDRFTPTVFKSESVTPRSIML